MGPIKKTVMDDLLGYINPKPVNIDSDGEFEAVKTVEKGYTSSDDELGPPPNRNRKRPLDISEHDERYAGKKLSRSKLETGNNRESEAKNKVSVFKEEFSSSDDSLLDAEHEDDGGRNVGSDDDSDDSASSSDEDENAAVEQGDEGDEGASFQHMSQKNQGEEVEKGKAVRHQLEMWDSLLECRIKFQKCLLSANCLPRCDTFKEIMYDHDSELKAATQKTHRSVSQLLNKLLDLRAKTLDLFPETNLHQSVSAEVVDGKIRSGDEITSSEEEDNISAANQESETPRRTTVNSRTSNKMGAKEYGVLLKEAHEEYAGFRDATIQKWNDKTRVAVGNLSNKNFSAFEQSTVSQIENVLRDRARLLRRSQVKRASYAVLGQGEEGGEENERDVELFDDGDWYQQLVRELIERKCAGVGDPAQLGRRWLQLQSLRSKMRRRVDTRATKGRKVSYTVHPKLVSFMAPVTAPDAWTDAARSELYSSLFGKTASS
ncbi:protein AATF-like [Bacillus rossius redtenbacheri]|uniref:protein AATF-like n=1 Tax=Bacillus rossius redtenbacheri TaxID=93214 RepID=UPI002FDE714F